MKSIMNYNDLAGPKHEFLLVDPNPVWVEKLHQNPSCPTQNEQCSSHPGWLGYIRDDISYPVIYGL